MRREARGSRRAGRESHERSLSRPEILHLATPGLERPRPPTSQACGLERGVITTTVTPSRRIIAEGRSRPRGDVPPRGSGPAEYDIGQVLATRDVMKKWISAAIIFLSAL